MKSSGFDEKQAESVVETIDQAVNETVATKTDLAKLETRIMRMMWVQLIAMVGMLIPVFGMLIPVAVKLL